MEFPNAYKVYFMQRTRFYWLLYFGVLLLCKCIYSKIKNTLSIKVFNAQLSHLSWFELSENAYTKTKIVAKMCAKNMKKSLLKKTLRIHLFVENTGTVYATHRYIKRSAFCHFSFFLFFIRSHITSFHDFYAVTCC